VEHRHLRFFIAVAEELSFSRAAEKLRVAQPHLSREIRRLEAEMDVTLFSRDRRQIALTSAGRAFLLHASMVLDATQDAVIAAQQAHRGQAGVIRLGFCSSAIFGFLPAAVRSFRDRYPAVELSLSECNSDEQPGLVLGRQLDIGILHAPRNMTREVDEELLCHQQLIAALPSSHPLAAAEHVNLGALRADPWVFFPRSTASVLHDAIISACSSEGFVPRIAQQAQKLSTITSLVAAGVGVAIVPAPIERLGMPGVVFRRFSDAIPEINFNFILRAKEHSPAMIAFAQTLRSTVAE
jgi:DNA-binding transcriptional LysR family regulator